MMRVYGLIIVAFGVFIGPVVALFALRRRESVGAAK